MLDKREDLMLLNVLSASSFQKSHIPGSQNTPVSQPNFLGQVAALLSGKGNDYPIVTYCAGFHCTASKEAANLLLAEGHSNVSVFEGGLENWREAGFALVGCDTSPGEEQCSS